MPLDRYNYLVNEMNAMLFIVENDAIIVQIFGVKMNKNNTIKLYGMNTLELK